MGRDVNHEDPDDTIGQTSLVMGDEKSTMSVAER